MLDASHVMTHGAYSPTIRPLDRGVAPAGWLRMKVMLASAVPV